MRDFFKAAAIFAAGFIAGDIVEYLYKSKQLEMVREDANRNYDLYRKEVDRGNDLVEENQRIVLELGQCRITNWQVATYATQLKKQLDHFME